MATVVVPRGVRGLNAKAKCLPAPLSSVEGILDTLRDPLLVLDGKLRVIRANAAFYRVFSISNKDVLGRRLYELDHGCWDMPALRELLEETLPTLRQLDDIEIQLDSPRAGRHDLALRARYIHQRQRNADVILLDMHDITEQKRIQGALHESELRYRLLVENVRDYAIYLLEPDGRVAGWNAGAERMKGYTANEILGKHFSCFYTPAELERGVPDENLRLATSMGRLETEGLRVRRDGTQFWASVVLTALRDEKGNLLGYAKLTRDITEQKRIEEDLKRHASDLERSNDDLERFAYVASHDLQEPLRMVASYTQLLSRRYRGKLDSDADEFIQFAVDGSHRMQVLINDLLAYSRVGRLRVRETVDCARLMETVCRNLQSSIEASGATVTQESLPVVFGDAMELGQLFQNLVANSIKFRGSEAPCIHVSAAQQQSDWLFMVRDNGIGIERRYHDSIFEIFRRLHVRSEYEGTGIGLAICKKVVEHHGGRIWVDSELRKGTTIYFTLAAGGE